MLRVRVFCWFSPLGFWPSSNSSCEASNHSGRIDRIFSSSCDPLEDLFNKNLFLRDHHQQFPIGSEATYECGAGYVLPDGVSYFKWGVLNSHLSIVGKPHLKITQSRER